MSFHLAKYCVEDETLRLHGYSPGRSTAAFAFDPQRFAAHEK